MTQKYLYSTLVKIFLFLFVRRQRHYTKPNVVETGQARCKIQTRPGTCFPSSPLLTTTSGTSTSTSIEPKGYLTSLNNGALKSDAEIEDIKPVRMLFDSLVKSNPKHAIAAVCLKEYARRMRKIIKAGCSWRLLRLHFGFRFSVFGFRFNSWFKCYVEGVRKGSQFFSPILILTYSFQPPNTSQTPFVYGKKPDNQRTRSGRQDDQSRCTRVDATSGVVDS